MDVVPVPQLQDNYAYLVIDRAGGQAAVVENRGGAGFIAAELVAKAPPDGYTLLVYGPPFWIGPLIEKASFDPMKDFVPITQIFIASNLLVVHPDVPAKSIDELVALAKSKPGGLTYGHTGVGS